VPQFHSPADEGNLFTREWAVPWHAHVLPLSLGVLLLGVWFSSHEALPRTWVLSWAFVRQGEVLSIVLHIFVHGGWVHAFTNVAALLLISAPLISRLGAPPLSWARYLYLFIGSGVSGAAFFLALNSGSESMSGASGAIFGLVGALARVHPVTGETVEIRSARSWLLVKFFLQNHLLLFLLISVAAFLSGRVVGLAWEAHLGGLLFGYLASPLYLPERQSHVIDERPDLER
jgi:membrane associated rhomboid family serine protease